MCKSSVLYSISEADFENLTIIALKNAHIDMEWTWVSFTEQLKVKSFHLWDLSSFMLETLLKITSSYAKFNEISRVQFPFSHSQASVYITFWFMA